MAHKIVTFMCKTHVHLNPFLQTHISMKLWRKTPTTNTLKRKHNTTMNVVIKRPYKSCSQSIRSSPSYLKHTHVQKPFLANTFVYGVAEKTPQQTTLKKKHNINHNYSQKRLYKNRSQNVRSSPWYAEHTLYRNPFPYQWENIILYDKVSERARKCNKGAEKGRSYQRICSTSVQWCFAHAHDIDQQLSSPSALHKQPSQQLFWSLTLM